MRKFSPRVKGFTLIELLIVITIIATLLVVVFAAINPAQRLKQARDARRTSDVDSILTAIHEYIIDNSGGTPTGLSSVLQQLGTTTSGCTVSNSACTITATGCLSLSTPLATYLASIPTDPNGGTAGKTNYAAKQDTNGIVTVTACGTEGSTVITSSR